MRGTGVRLSCWGGCAGGGRLELILVLPDGSHLMVPAAWTDLQATPGVADGGDAGLA